MNRRERGAAGQEHRADSLADASTPAALCELGHRHLDAGRALDAQLCCRQALAMDPGFAEAMQLMGLLSLRAAHVDHAVEWFSRAVQQDQKPAYLLNLGNALKRQGRLDEAFRALDRAVETDVDSPAAWKALAQLLAHLNRRDEAALAFQHVLKLDPEDADAAYRAGSLLLRAGKQEEALRFFDWSDRLRPNHAPTLQMRTLALLWQDRALFEQALSEMGRASAPDPDTAYLYNDVGEVHHRLGRHEEALTWFDKALELRPDFTLAHSNKAASLARLHRFDEALAIYAALKAVDPHGAEWNEALLQLLLGNFEAGWAGREARWKVPSLQVARYNFSHPMWLGKEPIGGKTILIYQDEGLGDTIQFARYVPMVAAQGARVILMVDDALVPLLSNLPGLIKCIPRSVGQVPAFDTHCAITSLPLAFATTLKTIPCATPYLPGPDATRIRRWEERLEGRLGTRHKLRVGVVWSGNPGQSDDHNRSMPLKTLLPLLDLDAAFVSLQKDPRPGDRELLAQTRIVDLSSHLTDFAETAALVSCLDLVISVCTSTAHLAGALARPIWVLLPYTPDWRWLLDRDDSPWYPTARLFRQDECRDYGRVIAHVRSQLIERIEARRAERASVTTGSGAGAKTPAVLCELGHQHLKAGRTLDAELCCHQALAADPNCTEAMHLIGLLSVRATQLDRAIEWFSCAIQRDPQPRYIVSLGDALKRQGRVEEAFKAFNKAVELDVESAEAWKPLAQILADLNRHHEAALAFQHVLKLDPQDADAAYRAGFSLFHTGKPEDALALLDRAKRMRPDDAPTLKMRALAMSTLARFEEAVTELFRAHALVPDDAETCANMGMFLRRLGRYEEALTFFDRALAIQPDVKVSLQKGYALERLHRFDEALAIYAAIKATDPNNAEADLNTGLLQLLAGNFEAGWAGREARWKASGVSIAKHYDFAQPMWRGELIGGKAILIYQDEGLGDVIQFARYVPMLVALGARVILHVDGALVRLLSNLSGVIRCVPRSERQFGPFDTHCAITSLPLAFKTSHATIPSTVPYLPAPDALRRQAWERRLGSHEKMRVGLVWSGNPSHGDDHNRSLALRALTPLLDLNATFVSLQKDPRPADQAALRERPEVIDLTVHLTDFAEAAALIACLDLVITVDTSMAHLVGALACPTWVLLPHTPDWRWLLDRDDSPWYPTARLFRQDETRDHGRVIERVRSQLAERIDTWGAGQIRD